MGDMSILYVKEVLEENALEWAGEDDEVLFSNKEEFADFIKGRMKYIFVNEDGSYTIGYDDGGNFGGHEIDRKGKIKKMHTTDITSEIHRLKFVLKNGRNSIKNCGIYLFMAQDIQISFREK